MTTLTERDALDGCATRSGCSRTASRWPSGCSSPPPSTPSTRTRSSTGTRPSRRASGSGRRSWSRSTTPRCGGGCARSSGCDLSRHEAAALASLGIWFEIILMQLLVRHIYDKSGDQRARALRAHRDRGRVPALEDVRPADPAGRRARVPGDPACTTTWRRLFKTVSTTPGSFTATLLGEEILDWMQRLTFPDERVQPLVRGVTRIHVVEEARHVRYAREELRRQMVTAPRWEQEFTRISSGESAAGLLRRLRQPAGLHERRPGPARGRRPGEGERPPARGHADGREAADGLPGRHRRAARGRAAAVEVLGAAGLNRPAPGGHRGRAVTLRV